MLTKIQIEELEKGEYSNMNLAAKFKNHGKQSRQHTLPFDQTGSVITDLLKHMAKNKPYHIRTVRLNRVMHKRFK